MKIGIVGVGVIGNANKIGFEHLGHRVFCHDTKYDTQLSDLVRAQVEIIFVCVPTPQKVGGECDTSIVSSVISELSDLRYDGVIAIRSTVTPGYTASVSSQFESLKICFVPEFLRERCAVDDFLYNHKLLAVGTKDSSVYELVTLAHGNLPNHTALLSPTEAELLKYYNNVYAALRITFANVFFEACEKLGADYTTIKSAYAKTGKTSGWYLDVNENLRGYGGMCLPKDTKAFAALLEKLGLDFDIVQSIDRDNSKFECTVFDGMRK